VIGLETLEAYDTWAGTLSLVGRLAKTNYIRCSYELAVLGVDCKEERLDSLLDDWGHVTFGRKHRGKTEEG